jgi:hypothetical protein
MAKKLLLLFLTGATVCVGLIAISRSSMDYSENRKHFDGLVVYDIAALEVYLLVTALLFTVNAILFFSWNKLVKKIS